MCLLGTAGPAAAAGGRSGHAASDHRHGPARDARGPGVLAHHATCISSFVKTFLQQASGSCILNESMFLKKFNAWIHTRSCIYDAFGTSDVCFLQSQPLPALDNRMELAALGKVHSEPLYSHARRNRARRHRSSDLPSSVPATVSEGVETPDTFNFLAPELQQAQPARFTVREEAAYAAGVAAAIAAQQEQQHQRDAASFMQSLQQAAREQASAKEAAAVSAFPASNVLGEGGSGYGALSFAGASLPTSAFAAQPGFGAADLGAWNFGGHAEPEGDTTIRLCFICVCQC